MSLIDKSERILTEINEALLSMGDPARVRYFRIMATPGDLDGWVVLPVIELPSEGDDGWPVDRLSRYRDMVSERFHAVPLDEDLWAHCLFRTPEELENPAHRMGAEIPAAG